MLLQSPAAYRALLELAALHPLHRTVLLSTKQGCHKCRICIFCSCSIFRTYKNYYIPMVPLVCFLKFCPGVSCALHIQRLSFQSSKIICKTFFQSSVSLLSDANSFPEYFLCLLVPKYKCRVKTQAHTWIRNLPICNNFIQENPK